MTWIDYLVLLIVGVSVLISFWRGAVRELFSLLGWVAAWFAAVNFADDVARMLPAAIGQSNLRMLAAYVIVFAGVVLIAIILGIMLSTVLKTMGLGAVDRLLGAVVGLVRGLLMAVVLILAAGLTSLPTGSSWRNSMFSPVFEAVGLQVKTLLPDELARNIRYE